VPSRRWAGGRLAVGLLVALCAFGAAIRLPGLTTADLWFDDAWAALPAHVGWSDAVRMVTTTPLYTLALRSWLQVGPADTWWAQLPAVVLGVAGIAAVYALVRGHGLGRVAALVCAAIVAVGPVTVTYSTRVKAYPADLLFGCLVLWLAERWRREPTARSLALLGTASLLALWTSASTAAVVGGCAAAVALVAWARPELRRQAAALVAALAVGSVALWAVVLRHLPPQLRANWRTHGFLFGYADLHHVGFAFEQTFSGLAHGLLGVELPYVFNTYPLRAAPIVVSLVAVGVLVVLVVPPLARAVRTRGAAVSPFVASGAAVTIAVVGTLASVAPLGDGRTDEALYPALLLLGAAAVRALAGPGRPSWMTGRGARAALAAAVAVGTVWFGVAHVAAYPPTGLSQVWARLAPQLRTGDVVVIDGYESFTWGDEHLGPWRVSFAQGLVPWPMGFHVASRDPAFRVLSTNYLQPDLQLAALHRRTHRVWFLGPTVGGYSTSAPPSLWPLPFDTPTRAALVRAGWVGVHACCGEGTGTYAELFVFR
jgi:hypothetical protein